MPAQVGTQRLRKAWGSGVSELEVEAWSRVALLRYFTDVGGLAVNQCKRPVDVPNSQASSRIAWSERVRERATARKLDVPRGN